jgi:hypothetical protein
VVEAATPNPSARRDGQRIAPALRATILPEAADLTALWRKPFWIVIYYGKSRVWTAKPLILLHPRNITNIIVYEEAFIEKR